MNETTTTRRLVAAGKSVPTPSGTRATYIEFNRKGIKPVEPEAKSLEAIKSLADVLAAQNVEEFDQFAAMHFDDGCEDCESSRDAYFHEMAILAGEPPC